MAQTTNEHVRGVYRYSGIVNRADNGCISNCSTVFCTTQQPSLLPIDFSETVVCNDRKYGENITEDIYDEDVAARTVAEVFSKT
jgi:hypothetical protein